MSHDQLLRALLAERFGTPVREWKPAHRDRPVADELDDLHALQTYRALEVIEEAS